MVQIQRDVPNAISQRCLRVWLALVLQARLGRTTTYECLACVVGIPAQTFNGRYGILARVHRYCDQHNLPLLDVLVVGASSQSPGGPRFEDWTEAEIMDMVNQAFDYDWTNVVVPNALDFR